MLETNPLFSSYVQIGSHLIVIAGMRSVVLHIGLGNHAHLQEGAEDEGVVIENNLLHFQGQLGALSWIELPAELGF